MKKTFSCVMALLVSIMLLATSCNNASEVTFVDPAKEEFTDDGLSALTVKVGGNPTYRNIWPDEWNEDSKSKLLYVLTGTGAGGTPPELKSDPAAIDSRDVRNVFTWDEIDSGKAVIDLEPVEWQLTLTAYQPADPTKLKAKDIDGAQPVLEAKDIAANLTSGSQKVTFALKTYASTTTAEGNVDVQIRFFKEDAAKLTKAKFEVLKDGVKGNDLVVDATKLTSGKDEILENAFSVIGERGLSAIQLAGALPAGSHQLRVTFYGGGAGDTAVLTYEEPILIEGGNTSRAVVTIPEGVMGKVPVQPKNVQTSVAFVPPTPAASTVEIDHDGNSATPPIYGQKLPASAGGAAAPAGLHDKYDLTLTWKDMSYNETSFIVVLSAADDADTNAVVIKDKQGGIDVSQNGSVYPDFANIEKVDGSLSAGSTSITLAVPTSMKFKSAKVYAVNNFVNDYTADIPTTDQFKKDIGMFTVTYCLTTTTPAETAVIKYGTSSETTEEVFVMGYELGTTVNDLIGTSSYPSIKLNKTPSALPNDITGDFKFGGWNKSADYDVANAKSEITDPDLAVGTVGANVIVFPRWVTPVTVAVKFPSYSEYKILKPTNTADTITLPGKDGTLTVTAMKDSDIPGVGTIANYAFKVFDPAGTQIYGDGTSGSANGNFKVDISTPETLSWDTNSETIGGDYRVYVDYDFTPKDGGTAIKVGGSVYVRLNK